MFSSLLLAALAAGHRSRELRFWIEAMEAAQKARRGEGSLLRGLGVKG